MTPTYVWPKGIFVISSEIDVPLGDFSDPDPSVGRTLSSLENNYWNEVVQLGQSLKNDPKQDLFGLIEDILRKSYYSEVDAGIEGAK